MHYVHLWLLVVMINIQVLISLTTKFYCKSPEIVCFMQNNYDQLQSIISWFGKLIIDDGHQTNCHD